MRVLCVCCVCVVCVCVHAVCVRVYVRVYVRVLCVCVLCVCACSVCVCVCACVCACVCDMCIKLVCICVCLLMRCVWLKIMNHPQNNLPFLLSRQQQPITWPYILAQHACTGQSLQGLGWALHFGYRPWPSMQVATTRHRTAP